MASGWLADGKMLEDGDWKVKAGCVSLAWVEWWPVAGACCACLC